MICSQLRIRGYCEVFAGFPHGNHLFSGLCSVQHNTTPQPAAQLLAHSAGMEKRTETAEARKLVGWTKFKNRTENPPRGGAAHPSPSRLMARQCPSPFVPLFSLLGHGSPGLGYPCAQARAVPGCAPSALLPWRKGIPASQAQCSSLGSGFKEVQWGFWMWNLLFMSSFTTVIPDVCELGDFVSGFGSRLLLGGRSSGTHWC